MGRGDPKGHDEFVPRYHLDRDSKMLRAHFVLGLSSLAVACVLVLLSAARAEERNDPSRQALLEAIRAADKDRVQQLLRRGADVSACTEDGTTALMHSTA